MIGDSAGGGLSVALTVYLKDYLRKADGSRMFPLPGALALISPWVDLTCSSESFKGNESTDYLPSKEGTCQTPDEVVCLLILTKASNRGLL